jgi:hypothetical protein
MLREKNSLIDKIGSLVVRNVLKDYEKNLDNYSFIKQVSNHLHDDSDTFIFYKENTGSKKDDDILSIWIKYNGKIELYTEDFEEIFITQKIKSKVDKSYYISFKTAVRD